MRVAGASHREMLGNVVKRYVLPETVLLAVICLIDAVSTVYLVYSGVAKEANPILAWSFHYGAVAFMFTKVASFAPALAVIEWLRPRLGEFARWSLRAAIFGYLLVYLIGSASLQLAH